MESSNTQLTKLLEQLRSALGVPLEILEESALVLEGTATATARATIASSLALKCEIIAKALISNPESGIPNSWVLVFVFINGRRVAPPGFAYMAFSLTGSPETLQFQRWEPDVYDEWTELETLEPGA